MSVPARLLCNPFAWLLWILDFAIWLVYFIVVGWVLHLKDALVRKKPGQQTYAQDEALVWRNADFKKSLLPHTPDCETGWKCIKNACDLFGNNRAMGTRKFCGTWRQEKGHKIVKKVFGESNWITYNQFYGRALDFGKGLLKLGMVPSTAQSKAEFEESDIADTLLLWENTSAEWMTALAGAFSQSMVVATSYATLGMDGVCESVNQCDCRVVVCNRSEVENLAAQKKSLKHLTTIIYTDLHCGGTEWFGRQKNTSEAPKLEPLPDQINGVRVIHFEDVIALGMKMTDEPTEPSSNNMAVVMYTSGSTGKPKGVLISHANIAASVAALKNHFSGWGVPGEETYLAYLPAAHILELCCEIGMLSFGASVGYADPRTLSSTGAGRLMADGSVSFEPSLTHAPGAIQEFAPTCMAAVPKIWDILKKGIEQKVDQKGGVVKFLFDVAFTAVSYNASFRKCPLLGLIFKSVQKMTGGRLKLGISGGGPISGDVQTFIRTVFGMPLIQGYALTETCCAGTVQRTNDGRNGVVGAPVSSVEIRLASCKDCTDRNGNPYLDSDTQHFDGTPCRGRGEVHIRGHSVSLGYYAKGDQRASLLKKTAEEFDSEGWFHTGDIGLFTPDGSLKLVDRLKNLVKLKGGEYVALEQMEAVFGTSKFVNGINGGVMVYADGDMDRSVALVQVNLAVLKEFAASQNIQFSTDEELCANPACAAAVTSDLNRIGKGKLSALEVISTCHLISGEGSKTFPGDVFSPWNPENGFLTASNKTDRSAIKNGKRKEVGGKDITSDNFTAIIDKLKKFVPPRR